MVTVCRLCARWAERVVPMENVLVDNLQHAKDAIKQMFHLDLSCPDPYPNQMCLECIQYLKYSYVCYQQLLNAQKVFQTLQERGELTQRLSEMKSSGDALHFAEMVEEDPAFSELLSQMDNNKPDETVDKLMGWEEMDATKNKSSERVIEIKIEAMEELEIISCPLETAGKRIEQESSLETGTDENLSPVIKTHPAHCSSKPSKHVNELRREPMAVTVPPEQKANSSQKKCYVCYKTYRTEAELTSHLIEHKDLLPYRCRRCSTLDCSFEFRTHRALNKHLETHWYPFECAECRLRFRKKDQINEHLRNVHRTESWYTCKRCGMKFQDSLKYRLHRNAHQNIESGRHQTTKRQDQFHSHTKRLYQCCSHIFKHRTQYDLHKARHPFKGPLFQCTERYCRKGFNSFREWRRHMKIHFPNKTVYVERADMLPLSLKDPNSYPKACTQCHYVAQSLKPMIAHYSVHAFLYRCMQCEEKFTNLAVLRHHIELLHDASVSVRDK